MTRKDTDVGASSARPRRPGRALLAGAILALALVSGAGAAELKIVDIKAFAFLERAGKLSDNLVGGEPLLNAPRGGAPGGDTATGVLLDFTFQGDKNASPKYATAIIDLTQTNHAGEKVVTHKAFTNFVFGEQGVTHKAVFLEGSTCAPIGVEVHAGHTSKSTSLDFQCDVVSATR